MLCVVEKLVQVEFQHAPAHQFFRPLSLSNLTGYSGDDDVALSLRVGQQDRIVLLGQNRQRAGGLFSLIAKRIEFALFGCGSNVAGVSREGGWGGWLINLRLGGVADQDSQQEGNGYRRRCQRPPGNRG